MRFRQFPHSTIRRKLRIYVAWITSLRDGLNLVAKEYVAVQGLLESPYAIRTNPYDIKNLKDSLLSALTLEASERSMRIKRMFEIMKHYDVQRWGQDFLERLEMATKK